MRIWLLTILLILICSCGRKDNRVIENTNSIRVIDLLSEPVSEISNLSDMASDVEYIPLQTTRNSLIESIGKIIKCENKIYIKNELEIMCFDKEGRFSHKLDKGGRGPEEYTYLFDFDISSDNKTLLILSNGKILEFNNTGNEFLFMKSINLKRPWPSKLDMVPGTNRPFSCCS